MGSSNDATQDSGTPEQSSSGAGSEQEHAGNSGEGAASALAHLKTQTRQHRRLSGDAPEDAGSTGHAQ